MLSRLLPRELSFFDLFDRHSDLTLTGCREFLALVADGADVPARARRIKEIEHETDVITHHCVEALHKTFITPIDRYDIHHLITRLDDVMDHVDAAAERLALYELHVMTPEIRALADVLLRSAEEVRSALRDLRDMKNADSVLRRCVEINRLENEADGILRQAVARLFREEKDPITVIKWKEIYEMLETATDKCEDVANILEGVVLEHA